MTEGNHSDVHTSAIDNSVPMITMIRSVPDTADRRPVDDVVEDVCAARQLGNQWQQSYRFRLLAADSMLVVFAVAVAQCGWVGFFDTTDAVGAGSLRLTVTSLILALAWLAALSLIQSRDVSLIGVGSEEYRRIVSATLWVFGAVAVMSVALQLDVSRGYLVVALPVGLIGLITGRHLLRRNLVKRRKNGEFINRVVVLGSVASVRVLCQHLSRSTPSGYSVAAACIPGFTGPAGVDIETAAGTIPVLGDHESVETALSMTGADALAVAAVEHLGHENMRRLAWRLDALGVDLIVVPGMTDVAGPRLKLRPIDNLPLFHVARPRHDGPTKYGKRLFDVTFAIAALLVAGPIFLATAVAIRLDDGGPVFFRQIRVGHRGKLFSIVKFRTMSVDAEERKAHERDRTDNVKVFFKSAADSRITRLGRFLRVNSLDELPQLLNVITGSMSIVGPRPLVPGEGAMIEHFVQRRALVKPGMTGLWQISGRSDAPDEERIRLDHSYIDNWSAVQDLVIVWRTVRAVVRRHGAC